MHDSTDARGDLLFAVDEHGHEHEDREQEVKKRPAEKDEKPFPRNLLMQRALGLGRRELGVTILAQELDVASQGDRRQAPLRLADLLAPKPGTKPHRKNLGLDLKEARENIVPKLVHDDQGAQDDQKANDGEEHALKILADAAMTRGNRSRVLQTEKPYTSIHDRQTENYTIKPVQKPTMTRQDRARVFLVVGTLD